MSNHTCRWQRALVIGASSGIGEAIARALASEGTRVALVARRADRLAAICKDSRDAGSPNAFYLVQDVRETERAGDLFQEAATRLGGLDLVVYAAGVMPIISPDGYPVETDVSIIATNLIGAVAWLDAAADRFSRARSGTIIGVSSVAGDRGRAVNPVYNASKTGLNTYLEALRARLARRGVTVLTAKPGYVRTDLLAGLALPRFLPVISAERAAEEILSAAHAGRRVVYVPRWWWVIMTVIRSIPAPVFERLHL